jgi:hypothetical protein
MTIFRKIPSMPEKKICLPAGLAVLIVITLASACKKSNHSVTPNYDDSAHFTQTISLKIVATKPSPLDSAYGPLADSLLLTQYVAKGFNATGVYISLFKREPAYFSFAYTFSTTYGSFMDGITGDVLPSVPSNIEINKVYQNTRINAGDTNGLLLYIRGPGEPHPQALYFTGAIPADGSRTETSDTVYCQVIFRKKFTSLKYPDTARYASGVVSGYKVLNFGQGGSNKYSLRWDFSFSFENLCYGTIL